MSLSWHETSNDFTWATVGDSEFRIINSSVDLTLLLSEKKEKYHK